MQRVSLRISLPASFRSRGFRCAATAYTRRTPPSFDLFRAFVRSTALHTSCRAAHNFTKTLIRPSSVAPLLRVSPVQRVQILCPAVHNLSRTLIYPFSVAPNASNPRSFIARGVSCRPPALSGTSAAAFPASSSSTPLPPCPKPVQPHAGSTSRPLSLLQRHRSSIHLRPPQQNIHFTKVVKIFRKTACGDKSVLQRTTESTWHRHRFRSDIPRHKPPYRHSSRNHIRRMQPPSSTVWSMATGNWRSSHRQP